MGGAAALFSKYDRLSRQERVTRLPFWLGNDLMLSVLRQRASSPARDLFGSERGFDRHDRGSAFRTAVLKYPPSLILQIIEMVGKARDGAAEDQIFPESVLAVVARQEASLTTELRHNELKLVRFQALALRPGNLLLQPFSQRPVGDASGAPPPS